MFVVQKKFGEIRVVFKVRIDDIRVVVVFAEEFTDLFERFFNFESDDANSVRLSGGNTFEEILGFDEDGVLEIIPAFAINISNRVK